MLFYECTVKYGRETEDGLAQVKESYLIEGMTPTDVERRLMDEIKPFISGDCEVPSICKKQVFDLFKHEGGDNWYWVKPEMITVEDSGKELRKKVNILVQASTVRQAIDIATDKLSRHGLRDCRNQTLPHPRSIPRARLWRNRRNQTLPHPRSIPRARLWRNRRNQMSAPSSKYSACKTMEKPKKPNECLLIFKRYG